jgi:hypothetical protein
MHFTKSFPSNDVRDAQTDKLKGNGEMTLFEVRIATVGRSS